MTDGPVPTGAWRDGPRSTPGPAVVFDIDGVLSDAAGRQHFLERGRRDWDAFFDACGDDPLIGEVARLLELLDPELRIVLLTGRPMRVQPQTLAWLDALRAAVGPAGHARLGATTRQVSLVQAGHAWPSCAPSASTCGSPSRTTPATVDMFHAEGIPCIYIHSGYYE